MFVLSARIVLIFGVVANLPFMDLKMGRLLVLDCFVLSVPNLLGLRVFRHVRSRGLAAVGVTKLFVVTAITFVGLGLTNLSRRARGDGLRASRVAQAVLGDGL